MTPLKIWGFFFFSLFFFSCTETPVGPVEGGDPTLVWALHQNFPNPFSDTTRIPYEVPRSTYASLKIYDKYHNFVRVLAQNSSHPPGKFTLRWDGRDDKYKNVEPGIYIIELWGAQPEQYIRRIIAVRK